MVCPVVEFSDNFICKEDGDRAAMDIYVLLEFRLSCINILDRRVLNMSTETCIMLICAY